LILTACGADKDDAADKGKDKNKPQSQQPAEGTKDPPVTRSNDKQPVPAAAETAGGDPVNGPEAEAPKSRVFSAIGRAFFRGTTEGASDAPDAQPQPAN
jgi:hypothetical protein